MKKIRDQTRNKLESQFELLSVHQQWGVWTRPDGAPVTRAEGLLGGILEGLARCLITRRSYGSTCHIVLRVFADSSDPPSVQPWTNKREKMLPLRWDTVGERVRKMVKAMTFVTDDCQFDGLAMSGLQGTVAAPFIGPPNKPYYTWRYPAMKNQKPPVQATLSNYHNDRLRRPRSVMPSRYGATLPTTNTIPLSGYNGLPAATTDLHHIPDSEVNKYQSSYSELSSALELPRPHTPKASHASGPTPLSEMTENAGASSSSSKQNEDASDFREHIEFVDDHLLVGPSTTFSLNVPNDNMSQSSMAPNVDGSYVFGPGNENLIAMPPNPYAPYCDVFDSDAHYRWTPQVVQYSPSPYGFWE
ncbi:hypothetical protein EUX98_g6278 [Antrodiella citrinella]|uniref:Uncharacterized protein n=1 Tax=Antrodiella citrinella TaxID=2447956 RepID=A0A4S4MPI2_9APHY|nr:hypothetical protein EUX98_g6278 [Antrodiella citrinella]